jgi:hypothetical protein
LIVLAVFTEFVLICFVVVDDCQDRHTFKHFQAQMMQNVAGREIPSPGFPGTTTLCRQKHYLSNCQSASQSVRLQNVELASQLKIKYFNSQIGL